ncbi:MAG: RNA polymerase factor sigma-54 [Bacteroidales bacterium]|nr:RNA polymerase factor sigma-54 [Bacteroidales bacterium]
MTAVKESLNIQQQQQLTQRLSPRQLQYVRLLEMTGPEVDAEVQLQLDDNPALESLDAFEAAADAEQEAQGNETLVDVAADEDPADVPHYPAASQATDPSTWQVAADGPDLWTVLTDQLGQMELDDLTRSMAQYIVGNLDANGYLSRSIAAMANDMAITTGIEATEEQLRGALEKVRKLDPAGVGASDLRECLLLQLQRIRPVTFTLKIANEIVRDCFDLFSKKHYERLQAQLGIDDAEEIKHAIDLILTLNPKPGAVYEGNSLTRMGQITPDLMLEELDNGRYSLSLASGLPQLQVERSFVLDDNWQPRNQGEREAQAFIKLKRDEAEIFISALKQRGATLLQVAEAIVARQRAFFRTGDRSQLKPMILKDIAADTGLDLSMISRATAGKYIATPLGCYPLKMFFNEAPQDDSDTSSHQVMHALQQIVDQEDKKRPLSDEALTAALAEQGFSMARRTVSKYREKMGIPVGRLRKKL